jgi:hypothetical protein
VLLVREVRQLRRRVPIEVPDEPTVLEVVV